jgi:limonene-1,2-epoxide hydrolase
MPEDSVTPDLAVLVQRLADAASARDFDSMVSYYAPDAIFESVGMGAFEGRAAIRAFIEDWIGAFEDYEMEAEGIRALGNGVTFGVLVQRGRLAGSDRWVEVRYAGVSSWTDGLIERTAYYTDIDEGLATAERLAEERG